MIAGKVPPRVDASTEVWLDFTVSPTGAGNAMTVVRFTPRPGDRSIVIHEKPTDHHGTAGARLACLPVSGEAPPPYPPHHPTIRPPLVGLPTRAWVRTVFGSLTHTLVGKPTRGDGQGSTCGPAANRQVVWAHCRPLPT